MYGRYSERGRTNTSEPHLYVKAVDLRAIQQGLWGLLGE
jgi:hypothetical protein